MAPEQARGDAATVGPRTDVFALGGVLYFLLTGKPPFQGTAVSDTIALAGRGEFDAKALDAPTIPRSLRTIVLKAMALQPQDRYRSAEDLALELERYVNAPTRRKQFALIGGATLGAVGLLVGGWFATRPAPVVVSPPPTMPAADNASLEIRVSRNDQPVEFTKALPLNPATDLLQVVAKMPDASQQLALFFVNAKGKVKRLPLTRSAGEGSTRYTFPADGKLVTFDEAGSGTEFVLLVGSNEPQDWNAVAELIESVVGVLPPLQEKEFVELLRDEAKFTSMPFGREVVPAKNRVETKLEFLRVRLIEKKMQTVRGIAYSR